MRPFLAVTVLAGLQAGCGDIPILQHYEARAGVSAEVAASAQDALDRPSVLPPASAFIYGRVEEVLRGDILMVRRLSDQQRFQVRLAGAELAPVGEAPAPEDAERAKQAERLSTRLRGQSVVVEVPPATEPTTSPHQIWGHIICNGRCLDALLVAEGMADPKPGRYPRSSQMRAAAEAAIARFGTRRWTPTRRTPPSDPIPLPGPVHEPLGGPSLEPSAIPEPLPFPPPIADPFAPETGTLPRRPLPPPPPPTPQEE